MEAKQTAVPDNAPNTANYEPQYNLTGDGEISMFGIMAVAAYWDQPCP